MEFSSLLILPIMHRYVGVMYLRCTTRPPHYLFVFIIDVGFFFFQTCTFIALILELFCYMLNCIRT